MEHLQEANKRWMWMKSNGNNVLGPHHYHPPSRAPQPSITKFGRISGSYTYSTREARQQQQQQGEVQEYMSSRWPPRPYSCSFCKREFRSAQALGGHMNVHRKDRAFLKQIPPATPCTTTNIETHLQAQNSPPYPNVHRLIPPVCSKLKQTSKFSLLFSSSSSSSSKNHSAGGIVVRRYKDNNQQSVAARRKEESDRYKLTSLDGDLQPKSLFTSGLEIMPKKNLIMIGSNGAGGKLKENNIYNSKRHKKMSITSYAAGTLPPLLSSSHPKLKKRCNGSIPSQALNGMKSSSGGSCCREQLDLELRLGG